MDERVKNTGARAPESGVMPAAAGQERLSWQEILRDPEYRAAFDSAVQSIVKRRLKNRGDAQQRLERMEPLFAALRMCYGEDALEDEGVMLAERIVKGLKDAEQELWQVERHLDRLMEQAEELSGSFPDFELFAALEEPEFLRLTAPHTGLSLRDAYYVLHREEIGRRAAQEIMEKISRSISSGAARPRESGGSAPAELSAQPSSMSRAQREALKKRIYAARARGERVYPY